MMIINLIYMAQFDTDGILTELNIVVTYIHAAICGRTLGVEEVGCQIYSGALAVSHTTGFHVDTFFFSSHYFCALL